MGNELDVIVTDHKIKIRMQNPSKTERTGRAWDDEHYVSGNIHHEEYANPVKITVDEDEAEVITSEKYKHYMENKLMKDIISETSEDAMLTLPQAVVILAGLQVALTSVVAFLVI